MYSDFFKRNADVSSLVPSFASSYDTDDDDDAADDDFGIPVKSFPSSDHADRLHDSSSGGSAAGEDIRIRELDINRVIKPTEDGLDVESGGQKITIIGKPGSGKSVLIKYLLYAKRNLIPAGIVVSGSEEVNKFYSKFFPDLFIYEQLDLSIIEAIEKRQKYAKSIKNRWLIFIMDDCMHDVKIFNDPRMAKLLKTSRHWNVLSIFANQYVYDFIPSIRTNLDGVFIFREPNKNNREKIYRDIASIIPSYAIFAQIMDKLTNDYTALYINNQTTSNNWQDCIHYFKAPLVTDETFRFGCDEYWQFDKTRRNEG